MVDYFNDARRGYPLNTSDQHPSSLSALTSLQIKGSLRTAEVSNSSASEDRDQPVENDIEPTGFRFHK